LAWERFVAIDQSVIDRIAVARGLQDADAHDLTQQVLMAVVTAIPRWVRSSPSARFHHWLRRVTRNSIINVVTRRKIAQYDVVT
jgi:RNA polymerase sigma-70 factor, ECF subfamily